MQGLLLVWRGCLFAGLYWMCTDYEAGSLTRSFPRSRDRPNHGTSRFMPGLSAIHRFVTAVIHRYVSKSGECSR